MTKGLMERLAEGVVLGDGGYYLSSSGVATCRPARSSRR